MHKNAQSTLQPFYKLPLFSYILLVRCDDIDDNEMKLLHWCKELGFA